MLTLCIPVINHKEETLFCIESFKSAADHWEDIELVIVDNASDPPVSEWNIPDEDVLILRYDKNIGVLDAHQAGYEHSHGDFIYYSHNDVTMFEKGWDTKIIETLTSASCDHLNTIGCLGFFGAKGIGTQDLYKEPYQINQLVRIGPVGPSRMPVHHGHRVCTCLERVAVLDGFAMVISREFLDENGGFDPCTGPHHNYDNNICLDSLDRGFINVVIPMDILHHGGMTDVNEDWNEEFGKTKQEIHADAHYPNFYNKWRIGGHEGQNVHLPLVVQ